MFCWPAHYKYRWQLKYTDAYIVLIPMSFAVVVTCSLSDEQTDANTLKGSASLQSAHNVVVFN